VTLFARNEELPLGFCEAAQQLTTGPKRSAPAISHDGTKTFKKLIKIAHSSLTIDTGTERSFF
jgi:hypothetical protein